MKKRLLSLALCLALCLGLFPFGALAADGGGVYKGTGDPEAASVISVSGTTTNYATLPAALDAARDGDTVKLLENHTTNWSNVEAGEEQMAVVKTRITLDLNGNTVDYLVVGEVVPDEEGGIIDSTNGNLTVKSSRSGGTAMDGQITTLKFVQGTLSVQDGVIIGSSSSSTGLICGADSGAVAISGGMVYNATVGKGAAVTVSGGSMHQGRWTNYGTLNITGGTFGSVEFYNNGGTIAISGGTFNTLRNYENESEWPIAPMPLLAPGHAFYDTNENTVKDGSSRGYLQNVTVKEHTHTMVNSKCACGLSCTHTDTEGASTIGNDGKCTVCGTQFAAVIGETYYADVPSALNAAADGQTVKLLADGTLSGSNTDLGQSLTLDLNGYVLGSNGSLTVKSGAALTVTNAGGEKSKNPIKVGLYLNLLVEKGGSFTCTDGVLRYLGLLSAGTGDYAIQLAEGENHCTFGGFAQGDESATVGDLLKAAPGMALHGDNSGSDVQITRSTLISKGFTYFSFYVGPCSEHQMDANGTCIYCGASYVASVMASGGVTTNYTSLDDALDAMKDGDTVTLLSDAEITRWHSLSKAFTLELNGKTATTQSNAELYLYARVIVQDSSTGKTGGMAGTALLNVQSNGDLIIKSGTFNGRIAINDGKLTIKGGTFNQEVDLRGGDSDSVFFSGGTFAKIFYPKSSGSFLDLLADGCAFYDNNDQLVNAANSTGRYLYLYNVKVKEHQHSFTDGACACGYTCPHTSVDANGACMVCHKQFAASITEGKNVTYYDTFNSALVYATKNNGCTLKLLADVTGTTVMINNPFLFDLNGHNVDALSVDARATIKDSGTTKGRIGKVTVSNEKVTDLTLGSLLEEGYGFKYGNGYWANDSYLQTSEGSFVTVEKAPIQSVNVYAKDKNNKEVSTTIAYGTTGEVTLVSSCQLSETSGGKLSCAWYKLTDDAAIPPLEGATGANYTLPDNLAAGTHTYLLICTSDGYSKSAEITITVTPISLVGATVTVSNLTYNGNPQEPTVTVKLGDETLSRDNDYTVQVTKQTDAGSYKLTIKGGGNYSGEIKDVEWKIEPMKIDHAKFIKNITKTYSGEAEFTLPLAEKTNCLEFYDSHMTPISIPEGKYTISGMRFVAKNAEGEYVDSPQVGDKVIQFTITFLSNNYVLQTACDEQPASSKTYNQSGGAIFTITKAPALDSTAATLTVANNHQGTYTFDLKALLPTLEAPKSYGSISYETPTISLGNYYTEGAKIEDGVLFIPIDAVNSTEEKGIGTIIVVVTTENYNDITLTLNVSSANKKVPTGTPTLSKTALTYGDTLSGITLSGSMKDGDNEVAGTFTWENPNEILTAGKHQAGWVFTPTDSAHYIEVTGESEVTVAKATPTGTPSYTAITESGKTLEDAHLAVGTIQPEGFIQWVDADGKEINVSTEVKANTAYTWKFMPDDKENYNTLTGTITLWHKSSSSSSSGSVTPGTKTDTVKNPDGSTTKTETKADGSKTETTTASSGGGSTGITVTKTDAKGNTTTEASAKLSDRDVKEAQEKGEAVTVPVKGIAAAKDANAATKIKIDVPNNANKTTVEIPVENVTSGTVAVIVHEDGTEELVKDSKPTEHGVQLELSGSTTVKIIDNSKTFDDTKDHWSRDEVNFVAARDLFNGVGGNRFGVSEPMTRGMVNTVLARLAGVDTTPSQGQAWYEVGTDWAKKNGISDGTDPTAPVTREQLATLLYRYAGSPSVSGTLHAADAASVSDYAEDALLWANQNGIVNGVGSNTIAPKDNAQRAQVAAMLARYLQNQ